MAYVKAEAVAEYFDVTRQTVWDWSRNDPNFPVYDLGMGKKHVYRYVLEEIAEYLLGANRSLDDDR